MTSRRRRRSGQRTGQPAQSKQVETTGRPVWQLVVASTGTVADLLAIVLLFVTGLVGIGLLASLATVWAVAILAVLVRGAHTVVVVGAALIITLALGGILGFLWGPAWAPQTSRDADLQGYCAALGSPGITIKNPEIPRLSQGDFYCRGIASPINMDAACRWKWGPEASRATLADESSAYTWRCHPKYW
jgi:hypothetical protein